MEQVAWWLLLVILSWYPINFAEQLQLIWRLHSDDVIKSAIASQITSLTIVYSTVYSDTDDRKHQSTASLAFVKGTRRWPVNSPHKGPVTRENASIWWRHHEVTADEIYGNTILTLYVLIFFTGNIKMKFVLTTPIDKKSASVRIIALPRTGNKQLSEPLKA